jgi:hypothetical protein
MTLNRYFIAWTKLMALHYDGNILFPGEITGELTEIRADCIFHPCILCIQRCRILSIAILLGLRVLVND